MACVNIWRYCESCFSRRSSASSNRPLRLNAVASRSLISSSNSRLSVRSAMSSAAWSTEIASDNAPRRSATRPSAIITPSCVAGTGSMP